MRTRNLFSPRSAQPYKLSRSKLEGFLRCPRCFYLDRRLGIEPPKGPPFTLNMAVDHLLKKEFDSYRRRREPHPLMTEQGIDAIPYDHPELETWRSNFEGISVRHDPSNFLFFGAVDDLWERRGQKRIIVVDYKATSKDAEIVLDREWHESFKRQIEIYQWLLSRRGFDVDPVGYFVYVNARKSEEGFGGVLKFGTQLIAHAGSCDWVDGALVRARKCLEAGVPPAAAGSCEFCAYRREAAMVEEAAD